MSMFICGLDDTRADRGDCSNPIHLTTQGSPVLQGGEDVNRDPAITAWDQSSINQEEQR